MPAKPRIHPPLLVLLALSVASPVAGLADPEPSAPAVPSRLPDTVDNRVLGILPHSYKLLTFKRLDGFGQAADRLTRSV